MTALTDWYRNTEWSSDIADHFYAKLNRARSQRDQYLAIQALLLSESEPEIALELVNLYFDSRTEVFDDNRALLARGRAFVTLGELDLARETYEAGLALIQTASSSGRHLSGWGIGDALLELIVKARMQEHYCRALELCSNPSADIAFPVDRFKYHGYRGLLLKALGRMEEADVAIEAAIAAAGEAESEFRYHRKLGLVDDEHSWLLERLRSHDV